MLTSLRPATTSAPCIYEILVLQKRLVKGAWVMLTTHTRDTTCTFGGL